MPKWQKLVLAGIAIVVLWIAVFTVISCAVGDTESGGTDSGAYNPSCSVKEQHPSQKLTNGHANWEMRLVCEE